MQDNNQLNMIPMYNEELKKIVEGIFIKASSFCLKGNDRCQSHYADIKNKDGIHTCPFGFNSFVVNETGRSTIFTAFRLEKLYNKKKVQPKIDQNLYNPILTEKQFYEMLRHFNNVTSLFSENVELKEFTKDVIHEVKNFNAQIMSKAEYLTNKLNDHKNKPVFEMGKNILVLSTLISERFAAYDATFNPESIKIGNPVNFSIHGKFEKIKRIYQDEAAKKNVLIRFSGNATGRMECYPTFDLLPFLLIDNAIKYSPTGETINIIFNQNIDYLDVTIESIGPRVEDSELLKIFYKKYRTEPAKRTKATGSGVGLYLAQIICDVHNITISARFRANGKRIDGVEYGFFYIALRFPALKR